MYENKQTRARRVGKLRRPETNETYLPATKISQPRRATRLDRLARFGRESAQTLLSFVGVETVGFRIRLLERDTGM